MESEKTKVMVSVVTPLYDSSDTILETIKSVLNQTYSNWEMLIVDDCSNDDSCQIVQSIIEKNSKIQLILLDENSGAAVARNKAIKAANGRFIAFLDSDDLWMPDKLEKQIAFMLKNRCPFSFCAYDKINGVGETIGYVGVPELVTYHDLLKTCVIGCLTAVYDTEYFGKVEMPLIRKRQDFGLWLRLLKNVEFACGIQYPLGSYRVRKGSISSNRANSISSMWCLYREVENLSILSSSFYFAQYALRGVLRAKFPLMAKYLGVLH